MKIDISISYISIQGWMVSKLNLSGNELLCFALIYGFSQDQSSKFTGSINYICSWLNCSRPTAINSLKSLVKKKYIIKEEEFRNGVKFNKYMASLDILRGVKNLYGGSKDILPGGSKETLPNNISINNIDNNLESKFSSDVLNCYYNCLGFFPNDIHPEKGSKKEDSWMSTIEKLNRIDKLEFSDIESIVRLARRDSFWEKNFLSLTKLRTQNKDKLPYWKVFSIKFKNNYKNEGFIDLASQLRENNPDL